MSRANVPDTDPFKPSELDLFKVKVREELIALLEGDDMLNDVLDTLGLERPVKRAAATITITADAKVTPEEFAQNVAEFLALAPSIPGVEDMQTIDVDIKDYWTE